MSDLPSEHDSRLKPKMLLIGEMEHAHLQSLEAVAQVIVLCLYLTFYATKTKGRCSILRP